MLFTVHYLGDYRERGMGEGDYEKVMGEGDYEKRTAKGQNLIPIKLLIGLVMHFFNKIFLIGNEINCFKTYLGLPGMLYLDLFLSKSS